MFKKVIFCLAILGIVYLLPRIFMGPIAPGFNTHGNDVPVVSTRVK